MRFVRALLVPPLTLQVRDSQPLAIFRAPGVGLLLLSLGGSLGCSREPGGSLHFLVGSSRAALTFVSQPIDATMAGDVKAIGDIDGDGLSDLIVGGSTAEDMYWYRSANAERYLVAEAAGEFSTDGQVADIDGDGDLDVVTPDFTNPIELIWLENPGNPAGVTSGWSRHTVGQPGGYAHDVEVVDLDADGRLDIVSRGIGGAGRAHLWFQDVAGWSDRELDAVGDEGLGVGDVDADGDADLLYDGSWFENPGGGRARIDGWQAHSITVAWVPRLESAVGDFNRDGRPDVVLAPVEARAKLAWYEQRADGAFDEHVIEVQLGSHKLNVADFDNDGWPDFQVGFEQVANTGGEVAVFLNERSGTFRKLILDRDTPSGHNARAGDLDSDGDVDVFGAGFTGQHGTMKVWRSDLDPFDAARWRPVVVTDQHVQTFGLTFAAVDRDQYVDIISGPRIYLSPGGDLTGAWGRRDLPGGMHGILAVDIDGDVDADIVAQQEGSSPLALHWIEVDANGGVVGQAALGSIADASHPLGSQGWQSAELAPGGAERAEILISTDPASGGGPQAGVYALQIPAAPAVTTWPAPVQIAVGCADEGFAAADVDRDGDLDVVCATGTARGVNWYQNPGSLSRGWVAHVIAASGTFNASEWPDRVAARDLNGDGAVDVIVTAETGAASGSKAYLWQAPADPRGTWPPARELIASMDYGSLNNLDVADMDRDGDLDIILAEHRGALRVRVLVNNGRGLFRAHVIATGYESHDSGKTFDLDRDGDLDVVSIGYDDAARLHVFRNDVVVSGPVVPPPDGGVVADAAPPGPDATLAEDGGALAADGGDLLDGGLQGDANPVGADARPPSPDATLGLDGGAFAADAGAARGGPVSGGCSCKAEGGRTPASPLGLLMQLLLATAVWRSKRQC